MNKLPAAKTVNGQKDCPLFILPPELRNQIYKLVLCQKQPKEKTMTKLPADSPYEVVQLQDTPDLQPTNELLETCRRIYDEARNLFVVAQRSFWANNNFMIELRDNWGNDGHAAPETQADITLWRHEHFNLMPRIVVTANYTFGEGDEYLEHTQEHHLVHRPRGGFDLEANFLGSDRSLNGSLDRIVAALEFTTVWMILHKAHSEGMPAQFDRKTLQACSYNRLAHEYIRIATSHCEHDMRKENHMMQGLQESMARLVEERIRRSELLGQMAVGAVLKHLCEQYKVHLRPHAGAN